ncbi:hypothetical protein HDF26_002932 [Pedobacter cryoconitis]|uniref:hypothetical protein n=1 Tax=Pedobacter cryoconitis TaxID=188932 RepID=UPI00160A42BE|nr:hypothetical protein [Pedobacter cryoconitis]MBB6272475.1 hypothetical protein [Pedobacter cryoconitis]
MVNIDHVLIFKTNIKSESDKLRLKPALDEHLSIQEWNVDLMDEECVLRIISAQLSRHQVIKFINHLGYECSVLE